MVFIEFDNTGHSVQAKIIYVYARGIPMLQVLMNFFFFKQKLWVLMSLKKLNYYIRKAMKSHNV